MVHLLHINRVVANPLFWHPFPVEHFFSQSDHGWGTGNKCIRVQDTCEMPIDRGADETRFPGPLVFRPHMLQSADVVEIPLATSPLR